MYISGWLVTEFEHGALTIHILQSRTNGYSMTALDVFSTNEKRKGFLIRSIYLLLYFSYVTARTLL